MIFYTADMHFGFPPILHAAARPFSSLEEMNAVLLKNWNDTVSPDDTVYVVGDVAFNGGEVPGYFLEPLNGHKHLIRGNHDAGFEHQENFYKYFETVSDYNEIDDGDNHIILCHYPFVHNKKAYMIHGHIHNRRGEIYDILKQLPHVLNAGVDINFFKPVTLDELIKNNEMYYSGNYPELFTVPEDKPASSGKPHPKFADFKPLPKKTIDD